MVIRPERAIIRFIDPLTPGSKLAFAVTGLQRLDNGKDIEVPMTDLTPEDFNKLVPEFDLTVKTTLDKLQKDLDAKTKEFDTATQKITSVTKQHEALKESSTKRYDDLVASTTAEKEALIASHTSEKETLTTQVTTLTTERDAKSQAVAELTAKVESLKAELPYTLRIIGSQALFGRLGKEELAELASSKDNDVRLVADSFYRYRKVNEPIDMDGVEFVEQIQTLVDAGIFSEDQASKFSRDATRDEAYIAVG